MSELKEFCMLIVRDYGLTEMYGINSVGINHSINVWITYLNCYCIREKCFWKNTCFVKSYKSIPSSPGFSTLVRVQFQ